MSEENLRLAIEKNKVEDIEKEISNIENINLPF